MCEMVPKKDLERLQLENAALRKALLGDVAAKASGRLMPSYPDLLDFYDARVLSGAAAPVATPESAVAVLMRAFAEDPEAIEQLIEARVPCNTALAADPTVQCGDRGDGVMEVGPLGLINGILGVRPNRCGWVAAEYTDDLTRLVGFVELGKKGNSHE